MQKTILLSAKNIITVNRIYIDTSIRLTSGLLDPTNVEMPKNDHPSIILSYCHCLCFYLSFCLSVSLFYLSDTICFSYIYYLPTPTLGQDMTQGQFLSGV